MDASFRTAGCPNDPHERPVARPRFTPQALFGVIVIVVGVLFTLDNLDIIDASAYLRYWPAGLVAV